MDPPTCTFCSATAVFVPTDECRVCRPCAARIARLAASGTSLDVWDVRPPTSTDDEMMEAAARVAKELSGADDADAHYYLAAACCQMGLNADALRSAAMAVDGASSDAKATAALRVLLTAPLLAADGLARLHQRLTSAALN